MKISSGILASLACVAMAAAPASATDFPRHNVAVSGLASDVRPIMSFDSKSCLPIAATDNKGTKNGGLKASGSPSGSCRSTDKRQGYVRWSCKKHGASTYCGILYAYYFEKDQAVTTPIGHRHDWEHVIMWTKDKSAEFMTVSDHTTTRELDLKSSHKGDSYSNNLRNSGGKRYKVRYWRTDGSASTNSFDPVTTGDTDYAEETVNITAWTQLNTSQKNTLAGSWGSAVSRLGDTAFFEYLDANKPASTEFKAVH